VPLRLNGGVFLKASAPPLFLEDENFFQKLARVVEILLLREKGGVLMLLKTTRHLEVKAQ
jgi:hypothetical protein